MAVWECFASWKIPPSLFNEASTPHFHDFVRWQRVTITAPSTCRRGAWGVPSPTRRGGESGEGTGITKDAVWHPVRHDEGARTRIPVMSRVILLLQFTQKCLSAPSAHASAGSYVQIYGRRVLPNKQLLVVGSRMCWCPSHPGYSIFREVCLLPRRPLLLHRPRLNQVSFNSIRDVPKRWYVSNFDRSADSWSGYCQIGRIQ